MMHFHFHGEPYHDITHNLLIAAVMYQQFGAGYLIEAVITAVRYA